MRTFRFIPIIMFLIVSICSNAQKKKVIEQMPQAESPLSEETKLITYVIEFQSELADSVLYKRAFHWYQNAIKSMRVQPEECEKDKMIVAKGEFNYMYPATKKGQSVAGRLKYTMTSKFENGKAYTEITRFNVKGTIYTPIEPWMEQQKEDYMYKFYLINTEEQAQDILRDFKKFVDVEFVK